MKDKNETFHNKKLGKNTHSKEMYTASEYFKTIVRIYVNYYEKINTDKRKKNNSLTLVHKIVIFVHNKLVYNKYIYDRHINPYK